MSTDGEARQPSFLDFVLGTLIILVVSSSLGLGWNHFASTPMPLLAKLPTFREGDTPLGQLRSRLSQGRVILLDARQAVVYKAGHIPTATNLSLVQFDERYAELAPTLKDKTVIVYCQDPYCPLADLLKQALLLKGHKDVSVFRGGYNAWVSDGFPVENGDP